MVGTSVSRWSRVTGRQSPRGDRRESGTPRSLQPDNPTCLPVTPAARVSTRRTAPSTGNAFGGTLTGC